MQHFCKHFGKSTGLGRLAVAGGVALNCTANGKLLRSGTFDEVFVQPAAGDDGSALGAAAFRAAQSGRIRNVRIPVPFYGPAYSLSQIEEALKEFHDRIEVRSFQNLLETCTRSEEHTSELQSRLHLVCRLLLEKKKKSASHGIRTTFHIP